MSSFAPLPMHLSPPVKKASLIPRHCYNIFCQLRIIRLGASFSIAHKLGAGTTYLQAVLIFCANRVTTPDYISFITKAHKSISANHSAHLSSHTCRYYLQRKKLTKQRNSEIKLTYVDINLNLVQLRSFCPELEVTVVLKERFIPRVSSH